MPRVTRAALRSNTDATDSASNTEVIRRVFGEITGNSSAQALQAPILIDLPLKSEEMPPKKSTSKGKAKKAKGGKKTKKTAKETTHQEATPEILEDDNRSTSSEAVDEACENLRSEEPLKETYQIPMPDQDRPITPPSPAARAASKQLSPKTPKFDPEVHVSANGVNMVNEPEHDNEDSFVEMIESRSPAKNMASVTEETPKADVKEDSFIEQIVSRSPAKAITRIEDSVDAIDALEDALEEVGQALPVVQDTESPVKSKKAQPSKNIVSRKAPQTLKGVRKPSTANTKAQRQTTSQNRMLSVVRKASVATNEATSKPKKTLISPKDTGSLPNPAPKSVPANTVKPSYPKTIHPKPLTKPPFQPTKSTKPPTLPTFVLPGEAISQKLKAQREERLKREEEEAQKRKEFKAKPVRLSSVPTLAVKPNLASKARVSLLSGAQDANKENTGGDSKPANSRTSSIGGEGISKRLSELAMPKRAHPQATANTSAVRAPSLSNTKRISSIAPPGVGAGPKTVVTKEEAIQQKQRAKEIFGRDKIEKEEREREKKEKEEAAKKARAQAAERGRQASREWAEKQRAKMASIQGDQKKDVPPAAAVAAN